MTPRISEAIDVLLSALENGTLAKESCAKCAIGNLIQAKGVQPRFWLRALWSHIDPLYDLGIEELESLDFNLKEIRLIESAFESNTKIHYIKYQYFKPKEIYQDQLNGLIAVVETMLNFDDCKDVIEEVFTLKANKIIDNKLKTEETC